VGAQMTDPALVSCLMVTKPRPERFTFLKDSISAFLRQSYQPFELVIVLDEADAQATLALETHVASLGRPNIHLFAAEGKTTLGALRNRSVRVSRGDVLCQWDDDDLHHPDRVARQLGAMTAFGKQACYIQDLFQFATESRKLYWTNWLRAPVPAHPGTLMCTRTAMPRYPETGPLSQRGEDRDVLERLNAAGLVAVLDAAPHLFVYRMHASNLSPQSHLQMLLDSLSVSAAFLNRRKATLTDDLAVFDFGAGDVFVTGSNGPAFSFAGSDHR
jgi:glycosyltransferase involved in cell wall biosynthesis